MTFTRRLRAVGVLLVVMIGVAAWRIRTSRAADPGALTASGTVEATEAMLGFSASGRIDSIDAIEGTTVRQGAELARLDRIEARARRDQAAAQSMVARAQLVELERGSRREEVAQAEGAADVARERVDDARRDFARTQTLFTGGAVSQEQLDKARSAVEVADGQSRQALETLRLVRAGPRAERIDAQRAVVAQTEAALAASDALLTTMVVRAPFGGVVTVRHREVGEVVPAGSPVVTIMNPNDRWVRIYVPERRLSAVKLGMPATISADTYRDRRYRGEVMYISREAEFTPKTVQTTEERVRLVFAVKVRILGDSLHDLRPGMPADVRLEMQP